MDPRIIQDLTHLTESLTPRSVLMVCDDPCPLAAEIRNRLPGTPLTRWPTEAMHEGMEGLERHELVLVPDALDRLPRERATHLIACLRDLYSESLYVLLPFGDDSGWSEQDLVALGLERVRSYDQPGGASHLFRFNISDYKKTPDWLNPRHWANPEMWDKARW
jgi:hypothetical protein